MGNCGRKQINRVTATVRGNYGIRQAYRVILRFRGELR